MWLKKISKVWFDSFTYITFILGVLFQIKFGENEVEQMNVGKTW